jgi:energy-coupling factor transporter ATP-binding protein EcfA2
VNQEKPFLSIKNLSFQYPEYPQFHTQALFRNLNLDLERGRVGLLLAKPDAGKTTLCRVLMGLVPRFSGGELCACLELAGEELQRLEPYDLIERVGLVFQNPGEQLFLSRCDSEVAFALESLGIAKRDMESRIAESLERMGLSGFRRRNPLTLSGGEKKKLLVACLLAVDPLLWLLDETMEELDTSTKRVVLRLLRSRKRTTLILSAKWHDLFRDYVDDVYLLENKKVERIAETRGSETFLRLLTEKGIILAAEDQKKRYIEDSKGADEHILQADSLSFRYESASDPDDPPFELDIDRFRLQDGQTVALVGNNGSGKSTFARILCGLLVPERGMVSVSKNGSLQPAAAEQLRRFTGYLFQDPDLQIFLPTVLEELSLGLKRMRLANVEIQRRVDRAISLFHLPAGQTPPSLMSYGARKRLQAAVCYLLERPLTIIDEGDSGLGANDFAELVRTFQDSGRTVMFISHDHGLAESLADRVIRIEKGKLA